MIETQGVVVKVENGLAYVDARRETGCGSCQSASACGTTSVAKLLGGKPSLMGALNPIRAEIGDSVMVGVEGRALLRGSVAVYLFPLLLVIAGAMLADYLAPAAARENYAVVGAALGLLAAGAWLILFNRIAAGNPRFQPVILRKIHTYPDRVFRIVKESL